MKKITYGMAAIALCVFATILFLSREPAPRAVHHVVQSDERPMTVSQPSTTRAEKVTLSAPAIKLTFE